MGKPVLWDVLICFLLPTWAWMKNPPEQLPRLNQSDMGVLTSGSICGNTWEKKTVPCVTMEYFFFCFPAKFIHEDKHSLWYNFSSLCISSLIFVFILITSFCLSTYHNILLLIFLLLFIFFPHTTLYSSSYPTNQNLMRVKKKRMFYL